MAQAKGRGRIEEDQTEQGKAARVDEVGPNLLRADIEDTGNTLTICFNRLCAAERWPEKRLVKIFKKGDLRDYNQQEKRDQSLIRHSVGY